MGLVHEDEDVRPGAEVGVRLVELVDHRDDQAAVVGVEQLAEPRLGRRRLERRCRRPAGCWKSWLSSSLRSTSIRTVGFSNTRIGQDLLAPRDHREGLARALRVPDEAPALARGRRPLDHLLDGPRLVLAEDDLPQLVVLLEEDDVVAEELRKRSRAKKRLTFVSKFPGSSSFQLKRSFRSRLQVTP